MDERLQKLERRLASAQRQVRFLLAFVVVMPAIVTAALALKPAALAAPVGAAGTKRTVLKAPFDVVGSDGKRLMTVEEKKGGGATVRFYRPGNAVNAIVDCTPAGGSFGIVKPDQKLGIVLDSLPDGGSVSVYNGAGKEGVLIRASSGQGAKLTLSDKDGAVLFTRP